MDQPASKISHPVPRYRKRPGVLAFFVAGGGEEAVNQQTRRGGGRRVGLGEAFSERVGRLEGVSNDCGLLGTFGLMALAGPRLRVHQTGALAD